MLLILIVFTVLGGRVWLSLGWRRDGSYLRLRGHLATSLASAIGLSHRPCRRLFWSLAVARFGLLRSRWLMRTGRGPGWLPVAAVNPPPTCWQVGYISPVSVIGVVIPSVVSVIVDFAIHEIGLFDHYIRLDLILVSGLFWILGWRAVIRGIMYRYAKKVRFTTRSSAATGGESSA